ncbi:MAG: hypothetical protein DCC55_30220, partial [Chloroflexi bacterium]
ALGTQTDLDGYIRFKGSLISISDGDDVRWGVQVAMEGLDLADGRSVTSLEGAWARRISWLLGLGAGLPLFVNGMRKGDVTHVMGGMGLTFMTLIDLDQYQHPDRPAALPTLERLTLAKAGFRYIPLGNGESLFELLLDLRLRYKFDSAITQLLSGVATALGCGGHAATDLFGLELDKLKISGPLEIEVANLCLGVKHGPQGAEWMPEVDEGIRRVFDRRNLTLTLRDLPAIEIEQGQPGDHPRHLASAKLVRMTNGAVTKYGLNLSLKGLGGPDLAVNLPTAGLILYFYPDFEIDIVPQLTTKPKFSFLAPPVCYAEGVIDLGKPIPGFGGTQNRVTVDVGLYNSEVKPRAKITKESLKPLMQLKNYKYRFGGEVVWGDAQGPQNQPFSFQFVEIHYEGQSALFTVGGMGVYGLGGLYGRNIAPGVAGGNTGAQSIANWIQQDGVAAFANIKDWPEVPSASTWHPDRNWAKDENKHALGLFLKAKSAFDNGKRAEADLIALLGFPEVWFALAGYVVVKPLGSTVAVVIAYDDRSGSFVIKALVEYKVKKESGQIVKATTRYELGQQAKPARVWVYLGHFNEQQGGPVLARFFNLFNIKFYIVGDSDGLSPFGLTANESLLRPSLPGDAMGMGALFQIGPKKYGPSWLNIQLFGALGFNIGLATDPFLVYGNIYAVGEIKLKVLFVKAKLALAAQLYGMATSDFYRFAGEFTVKVNMPWPIDDVKASCDFILEEGTPRLTAPALETRATALARLESISQEFDGAPPVVPIDGVLAIHFNKPIHSINPDTATQLTVNDVLDFQRDEQLHANLTETTSTIFLDQEYEVTFEHKLAKIAIYRRTYADAGHTQPNGWEVVEHMIGSWDVPAVYDEQQQPNGKVEPHHVLYLNSFFPADLQFSADALREFYDWIVEWGYIPPCATPHEVCLFSPGNAAWIGPAVDMSGHFYKIAFSTRLGAVKIAETRINDQLTGILPRNLRRMALHQGQLHLPEGTEIQVPTPDGVDLYLRLRLPTGLDLELAARVDVAVRLRGVSNPAQLRITAQPDPAAEGGLALDFDLQVRADDLLTVEPSLYDVLDNGDIVLRIHLKAHAFDHLISAVETNGPHIDLNPDQVAELMDPSMQNYLLEMLGVLQERLLLAIYQLCLQSTLTERANWGRTPVSADLPADPAEAIDALWDLQLFEPNTEYRITYEVVSDAETRVVLKDQSCDQETAPKPADSFKAVSSDSANSRFRNFYFRTDALPSQDVAKYVGLTFPATPSQPVYPHQTVPFLGLKDQGLIRRIYRKHHGADVLKPEVLDLDGNALPPAHTGTIVIASSPLDFVLEELGEHCLPEGKGFSRVEINVWTPELLPDSHYAVQLTDHSTEPAQTPYAASFRTSRHLTFAAHVTHVQGLFDQALHAPVLSHATAAQTLSSVLGPVRDGLAPGFDYAVETIYRQLLGIDGGSLRTFFNVAAADQALYLVGQQDGRLVVWGIAIELDEPLLGKEGVHLEQLAPDLRHLAARGILVTDQNRLLVRDQSGSRLLIFNSDGYTFNTLQTATELALGFALADAVKATVQDYVERTLTYLKPSERNNETELAFNRMATLPHMDAMLEPVQTTLPLPLPPAGDDDTGGVVPPTMGGMITGTAVRSV